MAYRNPQGFSECSLCKNRYKKPHMALCATEGCTRRAGSTHAHCCSKCSEVFPGWHSRRCNKHHPELMTTIRECARPGCECLVTGPFGFCCSGCRQFSSLHSRRCRRRQEALMAGRAAESGMRQQAAVATAVAVDRKPFLDQMD